MVKGLMRKVMLAAIVFLALIALVAAFVLLSIAAMQEATARLSDEVLPRLDAQRAFTNSTARMLDELEAFTQAHNAPDLTNAQEALKDAQDALARLNVEATDGDESDGPEDRAANQRILERETALLEAAQRLIADATTANAAPGLDQLHVALAGIENDSDAFLERQRTEVTGVLAASVQSVFVGAGALVVLCMGLALLGLFLLRRAIVRPVIALADAAQEVASGRLDQTVPVTSGDEIGTLQRSFNTMVATLGQQTQQLRQQLATANAAQVTAEAARAELAEQQRGIEERTAELAQTNEALHTEIVERMQAEAALEGERALLARRVEERTADLSAANAELARAARLKDEFLASMSHELRTPLNTILGMAETVQEGVLGAINDEQTDALRHIEDSGRHLLSLINDILDLSKVEAGKLDLNVEETVLADVWEASVRLVKQTAIQKRLTITCSIDSTVTVLQADARRLKQMLVNLLSNAVKFTPEGGAIGLDVVGDLAAQLVRLTVWDTGIGIAADDLPRLFQPFVQLDSRLARHYTGTGLGLALVERMAALHGGSVAVESTLGQGTRFTITLPWTATPLAADSVATVDWAERPAAARAPIQRALVIDDSPTAATQLVRYLHELGAEARVHPCGVGALEVVLDVCPDVILLDIQLPDRSGWDVLAQLKADPRVRAIPVVVVSVVDDRARGLALGAAAYLVKPISRQQLHDALDTLPPAGVVHTLHSALIVAPSPSPATPAPVILLAEDEENNIYTLSTYLEAKGYQVVLARNGAEALSRADDAKPALILMDIQMPGMDGLEAIQRIRADTALSQVPIIALTALAMPGDRERCLAAGADEYLTKPVSLKGLVTAIEAHLQHPAASTEAIYDTY